MTENQSRNSNHNKLIVIAIAAAALVIYIFILIEIQKNMDDDGFTVKRSIEKEEPVPPPPVTARKKKPDAEKDPEVKQDEWLGKTLIPDISEGLSITYPNCELLGPVKKVLNAEIQPVNIEADILTSDLVWANN